MLHSAVIGIWSVCWHDEQEPAEMPSNKKVVWWWNRSLDRSSLGWMTTAWQKMFGDGGKGEDAFWAIWLEPWLERLLGGLPDRCLKAWGLAWKQSFWREEEWEMAENIISFKINSYLALLHRTQSYSTNIIVRSQPKISVERRPYAVISPILRPWGNTAKRRKFLASQTKTNHRAPRGNSRICMFFAHGGRRLSRS